VPCRPGATLPVMGTRTAATVVLSAALTLAACGGATSAGPAATTEAPVSVSGALTITSHLGYAGDSDTAGNPCTGMGGMRDIGRGTPVRVATDAGATLALGALGEGVTTDELGCRFPFTVPGVTLGEGAFFQVEVGGRGVVRVERADVLGGTIALTL